MAKLPDFLESREKLTEFFSQQFTDKEKGRAFEDFCKALIIQMQNPNQSSLEVIHDLSRIETTKGSHDRGVDLKGFGEEGQLVLVGQSKFRIRTIEEIDSIISKFEGFIQETNNQQPSQQLSLLKGNSSLGDSHDITFIVLTMSDLRSSENGLLAKYSRANLSSCAFYRNLEEQNKILFIDGTEILSILKANFSKLSGKLPDIELRFHGQILQVANAYIGVVSGYELKRLYHEFGEAIFFENIRLFLGEGSKGSKSGGDSVNQVILKTVKQEPEVMLARNNGITFRSSKIIAGDKTILNLSEASIINGCQTTMCFVKGLIDDESLEKDNVFLYDRPPFVLVKVVETNNSWDIAKSANFQNEVVQIDLELARYFRPQIVQRASVSLGIFAEQASLENQRDTPYSIIKTMTKVTVDYDSTRSTFIGLFSRVLNNTIAGDYTALRTDLLEEFLSNDDTGQKIFGLIFDMNSKFLSDYSKISELKSKKSQEKNENQESVADTLWSRLEKPNYQAFMNILVACVINRRNIYAQSRQTSQIAFHEIEGFLEGVINFNDKERTKYYLECWKAITTVAIENKVAREINLKQLFAKFRDLGSGVGFSNLYETIISTYLLELEL